MQTRSAFRFVVRRMQMRLFSLLLAPVMFVSLTGHLEGDERPNVVIILADDMGYSDLGCYGGEIETPNLDGLANGGLRFTQFYNTARCWPTRAALLTGYYAQQVRRDTIPGIPSGGRGVRPDWARLLPELLRPLGYRSYHSGKWHVDGKPLENGFDHSYLLQDQGRYFSPRVHFEDDNKLPAVERTAGYYATTAIADHAIKCLREHAQQHPDKPYFQYVAFTAPHFPLQALEADIAKYRDRYSQGWDTVREGRWKRMQERGLVRGTLSPVEREIGPPYDFPDALKTLGPGEINRPLAWIELTDQQRDFQATKMAIHAAMIDRMDQEIGRILAQLREMSALDNTLLLFLSDNGASAEIMVRDDGHDPAAARGSAESYLCLGPGWSTAANTPLRRHKTWVHEGGISTPLIVHWPSGLSARGELRHSAGHVIDLMPTIFEAVGGKPLSEGEDQPPLPGKSLVPAFRTDGGVTREYLWWSHEGNRAVRVGDWKLVAAGANGPWELYDLASDRTETRNLASTMPDKVRELAAVWTQKQEEFLVVAKRKLAGSP
jgi:arylsulfatase